MNIRLTQFAGHPTTVCITCGGRLEPDIMIATAYNQDGSELGPICSHCAESDAWQLRMRVQHHVAILRQHIAVLEHLVDDDRAVARHN